jgi:hypothetical protein
MAVMGGVNKGTGSLLLLVQLLISLLIGVVEAQEAQCVPVGSPDFGTCAGLDSECCR